MTSTSKDARRIDIVPAAWTAADIAERVRSGETTAAAVVEFALARIAAGNGVVNAFISVDETAARREAQRIDALVRAGKDPGLLAGVPIGVKDLGEAVLGTRTTAGSLLLRDAPLAVADSVHVSRLRAAGAIVLGRTASAEFGLDAATTTPLYGVTRNPWDLRRTPGGSSGGSAAAVAAGMVPIATGSDNGGSIRSPASHCNLVGFKPTFGRIPQTERGALLNCVGVLTKTVRDSALHLTVAAGPDDSDRFSLPPAGISYAAAIQSPRPGGLRAAFSADLGYLPVDTELASAVEAAAQTLIGAAQMRSVPTKVALPNMYLTYCIFALSELRERMKSDFNGRAGQLCPRLQFAMTLAEQFSTQHFYQAQVDTMKAEAAIAALFADVDVLITPVTLIPPHLADEPTPDNVGCVSLFELGVENFPMWANFGGCPSISVPVGFTKSGLPIGMLITGRRFADDIVLSIARVWEQIRPWRLEAPRSARDN